MKFPLIVFVFLLTVSSSLSVNITVSGTEGRGVSITCPYPEGYLYAYSYKYFYRGHYRDRVIILESDGIQTFAMNGRFSLKDNRQTRSFTVTISNLKMDDAGPYGCKAGHEYANYQQVELIVIRAPETTTRVQISTTSISPYTNSSTEHTSTASPSDLASVAGGLGSVLLVLTLCCGTFIILKKRKRKSRTALFQQNMQHNTETDRMSEEIPNTHFNMATSSSNQTPSSSSNQTPALHLNTCTNESTVYATVTNQQPDSNPSHTHSTNQTTDTAGDYNYLTATHPQNVTPDEDPLEAPRFSVDFLV
ncbi:CMRF35-like molecule 5 [Rhinichthys klamathensis goyatoka]|uniref:CMRF35-like molecule 5 n=1 Tax=Rhinichthys klamathensis goyatoka TaxID=3034132 RepID=UPI0024B4AF82|nr:CMRF35-like molecule 5 [Rhinichthys klamathensis goyatoka]